MATFPISVHASDLDQIATERIYDGMYDSFGGSALEDVLPDGAADIATDIPTAESISDLLSLESIVNLLSGGVYDIVQNAIFDFAKIMLIVLTFILAETIRDAMNADFAKVPLSLTSMLCISLAVYETMEGAINTCMEAVTNASVMLDIAIPILAAAGVAGGKMVSSLVIPGGMAVVISIFSSINSEVLMPVLSCYFAMSLASTFTAKGSLSGICKAIKEVILFAIGLFTTMAAGLLSLQKIISGASENLLTGAVKFTLSSVIPVVGGLVKDAFDTVLGCVDMLRAGLGIAGVIGLLIILVPPIINVLLYSFFFKIASGAAGLAGDDGVKTFLSAVSDVWTILAALTICQTIYLITATAMMAG